MRKRLAQGLGTFPTPGQPIPSNFQKSFLFASSPDVRPFSHNLCAPVSGDRIYDRNFDPILKEISDSHKLRAPVSCDRI